MAKAQFSSYYNNLEEKAKTRYKEKWQSVVSINWQLWPDVGISRHIQLPHRVSKCQHGQKLESVQKFRCLQLLCKWVGWIVSLLLRFNLARRPTYLVSTHVQHSQRVSATQVKTWVAVKQDSPVVCAHCACMAGLGEACSHMATLLFTVEGNTQMKNRLTCTSLLCSRFPPSFCTIPFAKLAGIDFSTPLQKQITSLTNSE